MTADEENQASWKCDGGPHSDWGVYINPNNTGFVRKVVSIEQEPLSLTLIEQPQVDSREYTK